MAQISGSDGNENLIATSGNDSVNGLGGNDTLAGAGGNDTILGGTGDDTLYGDDQFASSVSGASGTDSLVGGAGNDLIDGGAGSDNAQFSGTKASYRLSYDGQGRLVVTDTVSGRDGTDTLTGIESLWFSDGQVLVTSAVSVTVNNIALQEGNSGTRIFSFTLALNAPVNGLVSLNWAVTSNQANTADFVGSALPSGVVSFTSGVANVSVPVNGDQIFESDEVFTLNLSNPVIQSALSNVASTLPGILVGPTSATGTILNDDTGFLIAADASQTEEGTGFNRPFGYTVTRLGSTSGAVSVQWAVSALDTNAADYALGLVPSGALTFAPGQTTRRIEFSASGDATVEADEAFQIVLSNGFNDLLETSFPVDIRLDDRIVNDDLPPTIAIVSQAIALAEGNFGIRFDGFGLLRTGSALPTVSVPWSVQPAGQGAVRADGADFAGGALPTGTVVFASGQTDARIEIPIQGDTSIESDETYTLLLGTPVASTGTALLGTASSTGTIINDDLPQSTLAIAVEVSALAEGNTGLRNDRFSVTRSGDLSASTTVPWTVQASAVGSQRVDGLDFAGGQFPSGTLVFAGGETIKSIQVPIQGDLDSEADESYSIVLGTPVASGAQVQVATGSASGQILNDDLRDFSVALQSGATSEGNTGGIDFIYLVSRSGALDDTASLNWQVSGGALDAFDFPSGIIPTGQVDFSPGQRTATFTVKIAGDTTAEPNEPIGLVFSDAKIGTVSAAVSAPETFGTVLDDDLSYEIRGQASTRFEGNTGTTAFTFAVARSGTRLEATELPWSVIPLTANLADFAGGRLPSGTVIFSANQSEAQIRIEVAGDTAAESNEWFLVALSTPGTGGIERLTATGVIRDDDQPALASIVGASPESNIF